MDAHPEFQRCRGTPIPLPSALFRRRRRRLRLLLLRGDPPPTPHTLPSCSGEPLLSIRHFRAQVARSGPGAGGCRGGGGHSRGISVTEFLLPRRRRRVERRSPFWVRANGLFSVLTEVWAGDVLPTL